MLMLLLPLLSTADLMHEAQIVLKLAHRRKNGLSLTKQTQLRRFFRRIIPILTYVKCVRGQDTCSRHRRHRYCRRLLPNACAF